MGFRFYRRIRVLPGVTVNLSKRGISASVGVRGAHVTVGRTDVREMVGLPWTGLSYTEQQKWDGGSPPAPPNGPSIGTILLILVGLFVLAAVFGAHGQTLVCETAGDRQHCFDHRGYLSTEERGAGGYTHGWDNQGRRWTTWVHDGRTETWETR